PAKGPEHAGRTDVPPAGGSTAHGPPYALDVGPEQAGWERSSLRVVELEPGGVHTLVTGESEWIVLPLTGSCTVHISGEIFELLGRKSVFSGVSDFAYVPRDAHAQIASGAGAASPWQERSASDDSPARYGPAPEVRVELRGAGTCSRQVNNFAAADAFDCDRLIAVEVLTPPVATGPPTRRTNTTRTAPARSPSWRRSTTSRSRTTASATTASPPSRPRRYGRARRGPQRRHGPHPPTAGTARPSPSPAAPCTTSTSWRARRETGVADPRPPPTTP
ncbi:hypothetical protein GTV15_07970, partial [Streptomyces sp. SID7803]|nr:hypothetical protein [Streptomyces sp. SID7803]